MLLLFLFWSLATCRLSCLLWFQRKVSEQKSWGCCGRDLSWNLMGRMLSAVAVQMGGLKGGARTTRTRCCRPPSSPQQFATMAVCDCKRVARALCSQRWRVSPAELLTSLVATGPAWILSLLPSSLLSPTEPCHSHPVPTSNHRGGENSVCLTLYPNILTLILKALRHWEPGQLLWSCKCHLEEEHPAPLWLLPAPSQVRRCVLCQRAQSWGNRKAVKWVLLWESGV